ncbi:hypothetical protein chiPu_0029637, partial [Chiloscyllium punctatum]|nr:hypothetical protein [Chiloscyllium punctatum]
YGESVLTNLKMRTLYQFLLVLLTIPMSDTAVLDNRALTGIVQR